MGGPPGDLSDLASRRGRTGQRRPEDWRVLADQPVGAPARRGGWARAQLESKDGPPSLVSTM